jgi:hypothetical protein
MFAAVRTHWAGALRMKIAYLLPTSFTPDGDGIAIATDYEGQ